MKKSIRNTVWACGIGLVVGMLSGCLTNNSTPGSDRDIIHAEKPSIDTARVLETLELYRAKRYEGIQEALKDGVDHAFKLVLYGRKMDQVSSDIGKLVYLQTLDVAHNELTELPGELADLHYLQGFYANGDRLTTFPVQVILLPILKSLDLSDNQINLVPVEILRMDQLTRLTMDNNLLTSIPVELYELVNLEILELSGNGLSIIPEGIGNLSKLKKLDVSQNQISTIPREISTLSGHLEEMNLQGNQFPQEEIDWLAKALPNTRIRY